MTICDLANIPGVIAFNSTAWEEMIIPYNSNGCIDTVSLGANLLGLAIALLALVVSSVAFLLPLMITAVGNYQSSFFNTVTNPQCILSIKRIGKQQEIKTTINSIKNNSSFMNDIYRSIMWFSMIAFSLVMVFIIGNVTLVGNSRNLIYCILSILFAYLLFLIICLFRINRNMFKKGSEGSYVALAELQSQIIHDIYKDTSTDSNIGADDKPEDEFLIYHRKKGK